MAQKKIVKRKRLKVGELSDAFEREMFSLFEKYYNHVDYSRFIEHLHEKTHVFIFNDASTGQLIGFSTIYRKSIPEIASGTFLFSGDTVIHEDYWGNKMLQKSFFWFIIESKLRSPFRPVYWMLMSKGVKTYLMMRKNFFESYPNYIRPTPNHFQMIRNKFYHQKFPGDYNETSGLILFKEKMGSVKENLSQPPEKVLRGPEADYFFQVNPKFLEGDELACVSEIRFADFFWHIFKYFIPISTHK